MHDLNVHAKLEVCKDEPELETCQGIKNGVKSIVIPACMKQSSRADILDLKIVREKFNRSTVSFKKR